MREVRNSMGWAAALAVAVLGALCLGAASAEKHQRANVDVPALVDETQKMSNVARQLRLVWWIPEEFWQATFAQDKSMTEGQTEEFLGIVRPYTLVVAIDARIGPLGGFQFAPPDAVRESIRLKDRDGKVYAPIAEQQVPPDMKNFLAIMRPMMANVLGPMGSNMHWFLFPAKNAEGESLCNPWKEGRFWIILGGEAFRWRLPLGSLLPKKTCPKCGEKLSGAYKYCPYDGTKLPTPDSVGELEVVKPPRAKTEGPGAKRD